MKKYYSKIHNSHRAFALVAILIAVGLSGCGREIDNAELGLLVNDDPAYAELMQSHDGIKKQIEVIQGTVAGNRRDMDQKISTLRQTFEADRQSKEQVINELKGRLKTQKDDFEASYLKIKNQLEARQQMKAGIEKAIQEARAVIARKDKLAITGKEIGEWQARIENLESRLGPVESEISDLETAASLKKKKLKYL